MQNKTSQETLFARIEQEKSLWDMVPKELRGLVLKTIDELKEKFPAHPPYSPPYLREFNDIYDTAEPNPGFDFYFRNFYEVMQRIGYGCNKCNNIITGAPRIEPTPDRKSMLFLCTHCFGPMQRLEAYKSK